MSNNKPNKPNRSRSGNRKPVDNRVPKSAEEQYRKDSNNPGHNDDSWYTKNPNLLESSARISQAYDIGMPLFFPSNTSGVYLGTAAAESAVPGVMTLLTSIGPGPAGVPTDPVNLAMSNLFANMRSKLTSTLSFSAPDLMMYIMAVDSAFAFYNEMQRVYGIANTFSPLNRYQPKILLEAMGYDFDNIQKNLADLKYYIYEYESFLRAFPIPSNLPIVAEHSWMFSNVYKDAEQGNASLYVYVPEYFFVYSDTKVETGGSLEPVSYCPYTGESNASSTVTLHGYSYIREFGNRIMEGIYNSDDISNIKSAIMKAYEGQFYAISSMDPTYKIDPTYNPSVLMRIENAFILPRLRIGMDPSVEPTAYYGYILQDPNTNTIQYHPDFTGYGIYATMPYLNFHFSNVTPLDYIKATAHVPVIERTSAASATTIVCEATSAGAELITGIMFFSINYTTQPASTYRSSWNHRFNMSGGGIVPNVNLWTKFDWAPALMGVNYNTSPPSTNSMVVNYSYIDYDNFIPVSKQDIQMIHRTRLFSFYDVQAS